MRATEKKSRTYKICRCCGLIALETILVLLLLVFIVGGVLVWQLAQNNLNVDFLKEHMEDAITAEITPYRVQTEAISLKFESAFYRPTLSVSNLHILGPDDGRILTIEGIDFTLSRSHLMLGQVRPRYIDLQGVDLHIVRKQDQTWQLGFVAGPNIRLGGEERFEPLPQSLREVHERYVAPVLQSSFLQGLKSFKIDNSAMVVEDLSTDQALSFPDLHLSLNTAQDHLEWEGVFNFPDYIADTSEGNITMKGIYHVVDKELQFSLQIKSLNPFLWASLLQSKYLNAENSSLIANGEMALKMANDLSIKSLFYTVHAAKGQIDVPGVYRTPFEFKEMFFSGAYQPEEEIFKISEGRLAAYNQTLDLEADIPLYQEGRESYQIPLWIRSTALTFPLQEAAYPDKFEHKKLYKWLTQKLTDGRATDLEMFLLMEVFKDNDNQWDVDDRDLQALFNFDGLGVAYDDELAPLKNGKGSARIDKQSDTLRIKGATGQIKDIDIQNFDVLIERLTAKETGHATISFQAEGALKSVFEYIGPEPIGFAKEVDFDIQDVRGQTNFKANIDFPTLDELPLEVLNVDISATANDLYVPELVKGLPLKGGPVEVRIQNGLVEAKGQGTLANREVTFTWQEYLKSENKPFKSKISANLQTDANLRQEFGIDISDFVSGAIGAEFTMTKFQDGSADLNLSADLTPSLISYTPLSYTKASGRTASASLQAKLRNETIQSVSSLSVSGPDLRIKNAGLSFAGGELRSGTFPKSQIGQSVVGLEFEYATPRLLKMSMEGDALDARSFLKGEFEQPEADDPAIQASVSVDRLRTKEGRAIQNAQLYLDVDPNGDIQQFEMDGVAGEGAIYIRYKPDAQGRPELRAEIEDAGAALRAFDMYNMVQGGSLVVTGVPSDQFWRGNLTGKVVMQNFVVTEAPVLARLISALSLPGLLELLGQKGVSFSRMEADFEWISRDRGSLIKIREGRTSGSELGLTFEGTIDQATDNMNLSGTIVPVSTVNEMIGSVPLIGDILTGGSGALIAATYTARGETGDPNVVINPLSVLTPGILRRIFFEGGLEED